MRKLTGISVFLLVFVAYGYADTVYLKSGKILEGVIVDEGDDYIVLDESTDVNFTYYKDSIERMEKSSLGQKILTAPASVVNTSEPATNPPTPVQIFSNPADEKALSFSEATAHMASQMAILKTKIQEKKDLGGYFKKVVLLDKKVDRVFSSFTSTEGSADEAVNELEKLANKLKNTKAPNRAQKFHKQYIQKYTIMGNMLEVMGQTSKDGPSSVEKNDKVIAKHIKNLEEAMKNAKTEYEGIVDEYAMDADSFSLNFRQGLD